MSFARSVTPPVDAKKLNELFSKAEDVSKKCTSEKAISVAALSKLAVEPLDEKLMETAMQTLEHEVVSSVVSKNIVAVLRETFEAYREQKLTVDQYATLGSKVNHAQVLATLGREINDLVTQSDSSFSSMMARFRLASFISFDATFLEGYKQFSTSASEFIGACTIPEPEVKAMFVTNDVHHALEQTLGAANARVASLLKEKTDEVNATAAEQKAHDATKATLSAKAQEADSAAKRLVELQAKLATQAEEQKKVEKQLADLKAQLVVQTEAQKALEVQKTLASTAFVEEQKKSAALQTRLSTSIVYTLDEHDQLSGLGSRAITVLTYLRKDREIAAALAALQPLQSPSAIILNIKLKAIFDYFKNYYEKKIFRTEQDLKDEKVEGPQITLEYIKQVQADFESGLRGLRSVGTVNWKHPHGLISDGFTRVGLPDTHGRDERLENDCIKVQSYFLMIEACLNTVTIRKVGELRSNAADFIDGNKESLLNAAKSNPKPRFHFGASMLFSPLLLSGGICDFI